MINEACNFLHPFLINKAEEQLQATVALEKSGATIRGAVMPCICGRPRAIILMYKCLYCKCWLCTQCAEWHFGKTVTQYYQEKRYEEFKTLT